MHGHCLRLLATAQAPGCMLCSAWLPAQQRLMCGILLAAAFANGSQAAWQGQPHLLQLLLPLTITSLLCLCGAVVFRQPLCGNAALPPCTQPHCVLLLLLRLAAALQLQLLMEKAKGWRSVSLVAEVEADICVACVVALDASVPVHMLVWLAGAGQHRPAVPNVGRGKLIWCSWCAHMYGCGCGRHVGWKLECSLLIAIAACALCMRVCHCGG